MILYVCLFLHADIDCMLWYWTIIVGLRIANSKCFSELIYDIYDVFIDIYIEVFIGFFILLF